MDKARAFTRGFVRETAGFLTREELLRLPLGALVITCEQAMRFLTDYLQGDPYYKIDSPRHNLVRTLAQLALLMDMERRRRSGGGRRDVRFLNRPPEPSPAAFPQHLGDTGRPAPRC